MATPEELGHIWGQHELENERDIEAGIDGAPELLEWSDTELSTFFKAKSKAFETGMRKLIRERKERQERNDAHEDILDNFFVPGKAKYEILFRHFKDGTLYQHPTEEFEGTYDEVTRYVEKKVCDEYGASLNENPNIRDTAFRPFWSMNREYEEKVISRGFYVNDQDFVTSSILLLEKVDPEDWSE